MIHTLIHYALYLVGPFFLIYLINACTVYFSKRDFLQSLPLSFFFSGLSLYYSQFLFHTFKVGYAIISIACICGLFLCATSIVQSIKIIPKEKSMLFKNNYFSEGFIISTVAYILFALIDFGRHFQYIMDELMHWGKMVRIMLFLDRFYAEPTSTLLTHKDYPPFISLIQMLWCKVSGGYSEMTVSFAIHFFTLILILAAIYLFYKPTELEKISNKIIKAILWCGISLLVLFYFDIYHTFNTIYTDILMPVFAVYLAALILHKDATKTRFGFLTFILGSGCLMITKQMSITFILLLLFLFACTAFNDWNAYSKKRIALYSSIIIFGTFFHTIIWKIYIRSLNIAGQFDFDKIKPSHFLRTILGKGDEMEFAVFLKYIRFLFAEPLGNGLIPFNYVSWFLMAIVGIALLYYIFPDTKSRTSILVIGVTSILGTLGYAFTMLVLYLFCFSYIEMIGLASFNRYMDSYLLFEALLLLLLALRLIETSDHNHTSEKNISLKYLWTGLGICILLSNQSSFSSLFPQIINGEPCISFRDRADRLDPLLEPNAKVFILSTDNDINTVFLSYYLDDVFLDNTYRLFDMSSFKKEDDEWVHIINQLQSNDYLYVFDSFDTADELIGIYSPSNNLQNETLYKISKTANSFSLESVE